MKKIRMITLFSGYDSQALAMEPLKRDFGLQFDYELVAWCEIDEMAIHAHNALFPQWADRNVGDICKVNRCLVNSFYNGHIVILLLYPMFLLQYRHLCIAVLRHAGLYRKSAQCGLASALSHAYMIA